MLAEIFYSVDFSLSVNWTIDHTPDHCVQKKVHLEILYFWYLRSYAN